MLDNDTVLAIGTKGNNRNNNAAGHTRVYRYNMTPKDINGKSAGNYSGRSVDLSSGGCCVVVKSRKSGVHSNDGNVQVYGYNPTNNI